MSSSAQARAAIATEADPCWEEPIHDVDAWIRFTLRQDILRHLVDVGLLQNGQTAAGAPTEKDHIRANHAFQRAELLRREQRALAPWWDRLMAHLADGHEVRPTAIDPELVAVESEQETGQLFRLATLLWSVPVSRGFGRRLRFLIRDRSNGKLMGVLALGDPVFNLQARDRWIGWQVDDRRERLVNVMDAYVVGAVPPYAQLLCGKLIMALAASAEVGEAFTARYGAAAGIISGRQKGARLALVTVTSALGRSSLYNRLQLGDPTAAPGGPPLVRLQRLGFTEGYGHFQVSDELFERMRELLATTGHPYAAGYEYGQGPNWRLRVVRVALQLVGLDPEILRHGIAREVFALPLASNLQAFLRGEVSEAMIAAPPARRIIEAARARWIVPRAARCSSWAAFTKADLAVLQSGEPS